MFLSIAAHAVIRFLRTVYWKFQDKLVPRKDVESIEELSLQAANSDNLCDNSVVVVEDPEVRGLRKLPD